MVTDPGPCVIRPFKVVVLKPPVPEVFVYEAPKRVLVDVEPPPPPKDTREEDEAKKKGEEEERERKRKESLHTYEITAVTSDIKCVSPCTKR